MKPFFSAVLTVCLALLNVIASGDDTKTEVAGPVLCQGNYQTEDEAVRQLERLASTWTTQKDWTVRATQIRQQILVGAKLDPLPARTPLNAIIRNKRRFDGYTVESAAFEARPGFFVYGNLYRPAKSDGNRTVTHAVVTADVFDQISSIVAQHWLAWERLPFHMTWLDLAIPSTLGGATSTNRL
jgi:hypothetical protein